MDPGTVSLLSKIIGWGGFLIVLTIIKDFITNAFAMGIAEFLLKSEEDDFKEKIIRLFGGNGDKILEKIKILQEKK